MFRFEDPLLGQFTIERFGIRQLLKNEQIKLCSSRQKERKVKTCRLKCGARKGTVCKYQSQVEISSIEKPRCLVLKQILRDKNDIDESLQTITSESIRFLEA